MFMGIERRIRELMSKKERESKKPEEVVKENENTALAAATDIFGLNGVYAEQFAQALLGGGVYVIYGDGEPQIIPLYPKDTEDEDKPLDQLT